MSKNKLKKLAFRALGVLPDKLYLRIRYRQRIGFWPNLGCPRRFSEKLQWLKLNDRQEVMTKLADKLQFKEIIKIRFGPEYVIPVLALGTSSRELTEDSLPSMPFVLKTNHDSGGVFVVNCPESANISMLKGWLESRLFENAYLANREWEYKNIVPRWFIEPLLSDCSDSARLNDFKIHCFNGRPRLVQTIFDRDLKAKENWFDMSWKSLSFSYFSDERANIPMPVCLDEMHTIAGLLSEPFPYARVDFYVIGDRPVLGEITFRPYGGFMTWSPDNTDFELGDLLRLET